MAILRGKCHSTVKWANLFIKPYDFVECTPDFSMKFGSMVTKLLSFSIFNIHLSIFVSIYFKTTTLYLGAKNKIFSYIKATPTKKIKKCFTQTHAAADTIIIFQRKEAIGIR